MAATLDKVYFSRSPWAKRLAKALADLSASGRGGAFTRGHVGVIRELLEDRDAGPRAVINIGADALLEFLRTGRYKNIYEKPIVGGESRTPTPERRQVDGWLELEKPAETYFAAVALGGAGVRFYGEYCMVLHPANVPGGTRLFDRDSYDLLLPPLAGRSDAGTRRLVATLRGTWDTDLVDMLLLKMLPRLPETHHLITSGQVSNLVMTDQEFVEVHLQGAIARNHIEEVRQLPEEAAVEASISQRRTAHQPPSLVELLWLSRRREVAQELAAHQLPYRLATSGGKGYQWA